MDKFEQRARKIKVDDAEVNRIRKNIQTVCSNHATMYNKLKDFCTENDDLKKLQAELTSSAKRLGILRRLPLTSTGTNTTLTLESNGYKKLSKFKPRATRQIKWMEQANVTPTVKNTKNVQNKIIQNNSPQTISNSNVQYVVQTMSPQTLNNSGYVMIQNTNNIPVQVKIRCILNYM